MESSVSSVCNYLGLDQLEIPSDTSKCSYRKGLWLWKRLQDTKLDSRGRKSFESTLATIKQKAWVILDDWWNGRYHNMRLDDDDHVLHLIKAAEHTHESASPASEKLAYFSFLPYLFVVEMVWNLKIGDLKGLPPESAPKVEAIIRQMNDKVTLACNNSLRHSVWQMIASSCYDDIEGKPLCMPDKRFMGSTLEACPWFKGTSQSSLRMPFYLWDRSCQKIVESLELDNPTYYCISHTWGRWREKSVQVPGVEWLVPTNTKFDVLSLPEAFRLLDWPVRYIWFDLFCIPQEDCPRQAEEIGKQADIFRQASSCVIWMHYVGGWDMLQNAVKWLGLNYLRRTGPDDSKILESYKTFHTSLIKLSPPVPISSQSIDVWTLKPEKQPDTSEDTTRDSAADVGNTETRRRDPGSTWFSSLWTLQEAYLCPSAFLADQNLKLFGIGDRILLTLDNITSLAFSPASETDNPEERPGIIDILIFTVKRWELSDLTSPSRMSLLIAAKSRESVGPRAEAIMSAVGATTWFESFRIKNGTRPPQKDLVFSLYPLQFLREAQHQIGGAFFLVRRSPPNTVRDAMTGNPPGTMLPLAHNSNYWQVSQSLKFSTTEWSFPLSNNWKIQLDGSVILEEAAILADSNNKLSINTDGSISVSSASGYDKFESFHSWMDILPRVSHRFAIAVVRHHHRQFGIIVEAVPVDAHKNRLILVKTGIFMTNDRWCRADLLVISPVDWIVL